MTCIVRLLGLGNLHRGNSITNSMLAKTNASHVNHKAT